MNRIPRLKINLDKRIQNHRGNIIQFHHKLYQLTVFIRELHINPLFLYKIKMNFIPLITENFSRDHSRTFLSFYRKRK